MKNQIIKKKCIETVDMILHYFVIEVSFIDLKDNPNPIIDTMKEILKDLVNAFKALIEINTNSPLVNKHFKQIEALNDTSNINDKFLVLIQSCSRSPDNKKKLMSLSSL